MSLLLIASLSAITAFTAITPIRYYCLLTTKQLLIILLAGTPFSYSCQLLLPSPTSYSYELLLNRQLLLIITSYKPAISATIFKYYYEVTLEHTLISFSHQLFSSATFISYIDLIYLNIPIKYTYQNPFVTNHYQLLLPHNPQKQPCAKVFQNSRKYYQGNTCAGVSF